MRADAAPTYTLRWMHVWPLATSVLVCVLFSSGCAAPPGEGAQGAPSSADVAAGDKDTKGDVGGIIPGDTGVVIKPDTKIAGPDTHISADIALQCPGQPGCACKEASECDTSFCIETPSGFKCAAICVDSCQAGFKCATVSAGGGDSSNICVPQWGRVCDPCAANPDCATAGNLDAVCVDKGDLGAFCGSSCATSGDCPSGYDCSDATDVNGATTKQCVSQSASCACSARAVAKELSTKCLMSSGDGKCPGKRACLPSGAPGAPVGGGLTQCVAPKATAEICDGKDNDCDGDTDEATCNDDNACSNDACGGAGGCKHTHADGPCDADGSKCTVGDTCTATKCVAGKALNCDDANDCTTDSCAAKTGCNHETTSGGLCNADDNNCTTGDVCSKGACEPGKLKKCESGDQCINGKCNLVTGKCKYSPLSALPCDDNNPCTTGDICDNESCKPQSKTDCDDKNGCTADSCDVSVGCKHKASPNTCDDNDKCTDSDACDSAKCVGLAVDVTQTCGDGNPCTLDTCDKAKGCQSKLLDAVTCSDSNPCTLSDTCAKGKCVAGANVCACNSDADCANKEDGNACNGTLACNKTKPPFKCEVNPATVVKCDTSLSNACQVMGCDPSAGKCDLDKKPKGAPCDADGSVCTAKDRCDNGKCATGALVKCDDDNACTVDQCDKAKGCTYAATTSFCDADADKCTQADKCDEGICIAGAKKACKDGNDCTADLCDAKTGLCKFTPLTVPCDDGNKCTVGDKCGLHKDTGLAVCGFGKAASCDDGKACSVDTCDSKAGCLHKALGDGSLCDDGNKCSQGDACKQGACVGTPINAATDCDDKNACTKDACNATTGCTHGPLTGTSCSDGNVCTEGDGCKAGKCSSGTNTCGCIVNKDCLAKEDGNSCNGTLFCDTAKPPFQCVVKPTTVVKCDASKDGFCQINTCNTGNGKCAYVIKTDATPCDADGSVCSVKDVCTAGVCKAGVALPCDDLNPCTADTCEPKKGCVHTNQGGQCEADNDKCTGPDLCSAGKCEVGPANGCDDNNACTADSCDKGGGKCVHKELTQSCDDGDACTKGDTCGKNKNAKHGCLPGKNVDCSDGNVCTADACDAKTGCKATLDQKTAHACYTGDKATRGQGTCKDGKATCKTDATLDTCVGELKPAAKELCDSKDDDCDGTTDEGCAPKAFKARFGNAVVDGKAGKHAVRAFAGGSIACGTANASAGGKTGAGFGFYEWLQTWLEQ